MVLTYDNDSNVTAHNVDTPNGYGDQKQVEVSVIPLGHTVSNLEERTYKSLASFLGMESTHRLHKLLSQSSVNLDTPTNHGAIMLYGSSMQ